MCFLRKFVTLMLLTVRWPLYTRDMRATNNLILRLVALAVAANGLLIIYASLLAGIIDHDEGHIVSSTLDIRLVAAFGLLYLSQSLARRKWAAWVITVVVYAFLLGLNISQHLATGHHHMHVLLFARDIVIPLLIVGFLLFYRREFTVRSDIRNFAVSLRLVVAVLLIAFVYGVVGFMLLDKRDFHQEISLWEAVHRTIDQFNITTTHSLQLHTYRARLFIDSLSTVSIAALVYSALAFFQPIKARYSDQTRNREKMHLLLKKSPANSEDFFKLWPHDKQYVFAEQQTHQAGIAYHTARGVALSVGAPVGDKKMLGKVVGTFEDMCWTNDWLPAFIHVTDELQTLYTKHGYTLQKIGEEAVVDLGHFTEVVRGNKYFRQIGNRFDKQHYVFEVLSPPHSDALLQRLRVISDEWLQLPGRAERSFIMAYFATDYLQQCDVAVARDEAGTIQAFLNIVPSFDPAEANFDMLRHTSKSPGNINDFLLLHLFTKLQQQGFKRFNLGLSPLSGIDVEDSGNALIGTAMRFLYANGDRFYSFSGLRRFKSKYEPVWLSRYIAHKGGVRGFTRTYTALNKAMRAPKRVR
jgi:phosphatidylglycerol lysyltransferase